MVKTKSVGWECDIVIIKKTHISTMNNNTTDRDLYLEADKDGRLTIPLYLASRYGIKLGTRVYANELSNGLYLLRPANQEQRYQNNVTYEDRG